MKLAHFLLAGGLLSFSAASAQTTPPNPGTASPSTVPSGMAPAKSNPNGVVSPSEAFTTGAPNNTSNKRMMRKKDKRAMSDDKGKMKTKM